MHSLILCLCLSLLPVWALGQSGTQTIRGRVLDLDTQQALVGASVYVENSDPQIGAITDMKGDFRLEAVPVGRRTVVCKYAGYGPYRSDDILLNSAKELVLEIQLIEEIGELTTEEVLITAGDYATGAVNPLSVVSTRSFSAEETGRFAAAVNDPGRLALSFPGVQQGGDDSENDIIIRGNSSFGMLWRLEGMDIPNPNHFARPGTSGGGITVFSAQLLDRSDFSTGGMPAEYGNALSGAMDVHFRKGNMEEREYRIKLGLLGLDFATEGPIRQGRSSYLANYRFSTLSLLNRMGFHLVGERVDNDFTDLSFNIAVDGKDDRSFITVFGLGGLSQEHYRPVEDPQAREIGRGDHWEDRIQGSNMATLGMTYTRRLDERSYLKGVVALMHSDIFREFDTLDLADIPYRYNTEKYLDQRLSASLVYNRKANARTRFKTGLFAHQIFYEFFRESAPRNARSDITTDDPQRELSIDGEGNTQTLQYFFQINHRLGEKTTVNLGAHWLYLTLNGTSSLEPRFSLKHQITRQQMLSFAYGLHSKMLPLGAYFFTRSDTAPGGQVSFSNPNFNLPMVRSHHLILAYHYTFKNNLRVGADLYLQRLFNVPVEANNPTSTWWMLNNQSGIAQFELSDEGKGLNYGIDLVVEKFFSRRIFFLLTVSRFESTYELPGGRSFNTRFGTRYASSFTLGKEFTFKKGSVLQVGGRYMYNGGFRYTPPDYDRSQAEGTFIRNEAQAWSEQVGAYQRLDTRISFRKNKRKFAWILALDIQNVLNRGNPRSIGYNLETNDIFFRRHSSGLIPVLSYQVDF